MDTSWIANWGSGSPVLGILVEFDALPGLDNEAVPTKTPRKDGNTNGHGCGLTRWFLSSRHGTLLWRALTLGKVSLNSEPFCIRVQLTGYTI
jgi:hypothetical protein